MSLERKDVRFKLEYDVHQALTILAEVAQVDIGEFCEQIVQQEIERQVHVATVVANRTACLGINGNRRDSPGTSGKDRD